MLSKVLPMTAATDDPGEEREQAFEEGAQKLMEAIDALREAGLTDSDILAEVKARLGVNG